MGEHRRSHWMVAALIVAAAACSGDDASDGATTDTAGDGTATEDTGESAGTSASTGPATAPAPTDAPTPAQGTLFPAGDLDSGLQPWIELATTDLATRLALDAAAIEPLSAVLVVWADLSLGCPVADRQYATILTDGAVIELAADGAVYRYHAGGDRTPFLCATPITTAPTRL
jgi:hypothetical protein